MSLLCQGRYSVGQRFGRHIDESADLGDGKRTHYTLLIYLSGGSHSKSKSKKETSNNQDSSMEPLVGGETVFYGPRNNLVAEVNIKFFPDVSHFSISWIGFILLECCQFCFSLAQFPTMPPAV